MDDYKKTLPSGLPGRSLPDAEHAFQIGTRGENEEPQRAAGENQNGTNEGVHALDTASEGPVVKDPLTAGSTASNLQSEAVDVGNHPVVKVLLSERDQARAEAADLRYILRESIKAAGGVAENGVSDAFLSLVPAEIGALRHKCLKLEAALTAAQADAARAHKVLERINEAMHHHGSAAQITEIIGKVLYIPESPVLSWLDQQKAEAAAKELDALADGCEKVNPVLAQQLRARAAALRAGATGDKVVNHPGGDGRHRE